LDEASADYLPSIEATNERAEKELGLKTKLVEKPDQQYQMQSKWVISKED
jgi:hypothetical protein